MGYEVWRAIGWLICYAKMGSEGVVLDVKFSTETGLGGWGGDGFCSGPACAVDGDYRNVFGKHISISRSSSIWA